MPFGTYDYEGEFFCRPPAKYHPTCNAWWAMTNYPVDDNNAFDIPHNIAWCFGNKNGQGIVTTGAQFAATGRILKTPQIANFATEFAGYIFRSVFQQVNRLVRDLRYARN